MIDYSQRFAIRQEAVARILRAAMPNLTEDEGAALFGALDSAGWLRVWAGGREPGAVEAIKPPYGPHVFYTRVDNPVRRAVAALLKTQYLGPLHPSIRALATEHGMAFGTVKTLLDEAGTPLRTRAARPNRPR